MNVQNKASTRGRRRTMKTSERLSQEEILQRVISDYKKTVGEVVWVRIDDRTHIELPANLTVDEREERIKNYLSNTNYTLGKRA